MAPVTFSEQLKLIGRPGCIVRRGDHFIPEVGKSAKRVSHGHRLQLGAYFLLIEGTYGVCSRFGLVVPGQRLAGRGREYRRPPLEVARDSGENPRASPGPRRRLPGEATGLEVPNVRATRKLRAGVDAIRGAHSPGGSRSSSKSEFCSGALRFL